jgi:UDP-N-acetylglucosamine diphosphorylase/glucosamine-1-phosphate N-acetyltransferase
MFILFDTPLRHRNMLPLTYTRPIAALRIGILTLQEKWAHYLGTDTQLAVSTVPYLQVKYTPPVPSDSVVCINAAILPDRMLATAIMELQLGECIVQNNEVVAYKTDAEGANRFLENYEIPPTATITPHNLNDDENIIWLNRPWDLFSRNRIAIERDFELLTKGRTSATLSATNRVLGERIFVEDGVYAECAVFNTLSGPIYLGKNSTVMEGAVIRGGFALCEHAEVKLSAKIYGPTTVGPYSKVGGEINNSVIIGYSNKGHDGFLGNSVLGEWCNLGADTNNSNLKNNYAEVKMWDFGVNRFAPTGLQFCGLIMGDHSKSGINTMFNTGTVVGVSANIFGDGFPRNYIPSFSWGGASGFSTFQLDKALEVAERVLARRNKQLDEGDRAILSYLFTQSQSK